VVDRLSYPWGQLFQNNDETYERERVVEESVTLCDKARTRVLPHAKSEFALRCHMRDHCLELAQSNVYARAHID
jgi:hypothetical protein